MLNKKKYLFMFVFILVLGFYGSCYAVSWVETNKLIDSLPLLDYLIDCAGIDDSQENFASTSAYNNYINFRDKVYTAVYYGGNFYKDNTAFREVKFVLSTTGNVTTTSSSGKLSAYTIVGSITRQTNGSTNFTWSNNGEYSNSAGEMGYFGNSNWRWGAIYGNGVWRQTVSSDYNVSDIVIPPNFIPNGDELSYYQWGNKINNITTSYYSTNTNLGYWTDYDNGSNYLYNLVEIRPATSGYDYQVTGLVATNQNYISDSTNYHYISVPTRILKLGGFYVLSISYYIDTNLFNDNYFFYINGSSTSGDQLILYSGDPYMDPNQQTNTIINNQKSGDAAIIAALTDTTPPASGEITINDLPTIEVEDVSQEFFSWLLVKVKEVLDYNGTSNLTIPLFSQNFTIASNVFVLPNGALRTFIEAGWYFIIGVPFLKYIRHLIEVVKSGNVPGADEKDDLLGNVL